MPQTISLAVPSVFAAVVLAALGFGSPSSMAQQRVGVSSAVNEQTTGTPPGAASRRLVIGENIIFNERVDTSTNGQAQILFVDESSLSLGPNSNVVVDKFVYNPDKGTGTMALSATEGVLRFVGGKLSKLDNAVTMRTPSALMGIRGGAFMLIITKQGRVEAIFLYGAGLTVTGLDGVSETITRPGYAVVVAGPGASPSTPFLALQATLSVLIGELDGRAGGSGGATTIPTEQLIAQSGIATVISGNIPESLQQAAQNQPPPGQPPEINIANLQTLLQTSTSTSTGQPPIANADEHPTPPGTPIGPPPPPPPPTPVVITYAGRYENTNGNGTARGFYDQSAAASVPYSGGILTYPPGMPQNGIFTASSGPLQVSFPLEPGTNSFGPANTSSSSGPFSGTSYLSPDNTFFYADLYPTNFPGQAGFIEGGQPVSSSFLQPTGATRIFAFQVQPDAALQSNIPFIRNEAGGNLPNAYVSPLYLVAPAATAIGDTSTNSAARTLQASLAIDGQGANQQSVIVMNTGMVATLQSSGAPIIDGVLRGSSLLSATGTPLRIGSFVTSMVDGNGTSLYGADAISGFALDQSAAVTGSTGVVSQVNPQTAIEVPLSGTSTTYGFAQPAIPTSLPVGIGSSRGSTQLQGFFGGIMFTTAQPQPYAITGSASLETDATTNRVAATFVGGNTFSGAAPIFVMNFGGIAGNDGGRSAFIDNNVFGAAESVASPQEVCQGTACQNLVVDGNTAAAGQLYLLSSGAAPPPASFLAGQSVCSSCAYLKWGYWGGALLQGDATNDTVSRIDAANINFWVAGPQTPAVDINNLVSMTATGTYSGAAVGAVANNGANYLASGGFSEVYNFGTQSGTLNITNFDNKNFTGRVLGSGAFYSAALTGTGLTGSAQGEFFGPGAAETGGDFAVRSPAQGVAPYLASGIFGGKGVISTPPP